MVSDEARQVYIHLTENLFLHSSMVFFAKSNLRFLGVLINKHFCQWLYAIDIQKARISAVNFFELIKKAICEFFNGSFEFLLFLLLDVVNEVVEFHGLVVIDTNQLAWGCLQYFGDSGQGCGDFYVELMIRSDPSSF